MDLLRNNFVQHTLYEVIRDYDWSNDYDDMDSGEWDSQYGGDDDDIDDEVDPWGLN